MDYKKEFKISMSESARINGFMLEPLCEDEAIGDQVIAHKVRFDDGYSMEVRVCGAPYRDGEYNSAWAEAILFNNVNEPVYTTAPDSSYTGLWTMHHNGNTYITEVKVDENKIQ